MNKKLILTSILAIGVAGAANATPTPANYPDSQATSPATMWTDKSYAGAAVNDNTGIYEGEVEAYPVFEWNTVTLQAGEYLEAGNQVNNLTSCPADSWCPGGDIVHYDPDNDQGINACSSLAGGFTNSDALSTANTDCYRACSSGTAGTDFPAIDHALTYTGRDQYGNAGNDTCGAASCDDGWHVQDPIGNIKNTLTAETSATGNTTNAQEWKVVYANGDSLVGNGRCSRRPGEANEAVVALVDRTGEDGALYCYCNVDRYQASGQDPVMLTSNWMFNSAKTDAESCESTCASTCGTDVRAGSSFTGNILASGQGSPMGYNEGSLAKCTANPIAIDWRGTTEADIKANSAESTYYGGDVRTPVSVRQRVGQTFKGWKFGVHDQSSTMPFQYSDEQELDGQLPTE